MPQLFCLGQLRHLFDVTCFGVELFSRGVAAHVADGAEDGAFKPGAVDLPTMDHAIPA